MRRTCTLLASLILTPSMAFAQASIAGAVRDSSGAVLPGVTVEAASPALIERARTAVTDENGRYQIIELRPGTYSVTFTLPGFSAVKRDGVELVGAFAATLDVEMRVGGLEETVTVSGEAAVVDVQNAARQRVMTTDIIDALPTSRIHTSLAQLVPGLNAQNRDVGGTTVVGGAMSGHGMRANDSRIMMNGISQGSNRVFGAATSTTPNMGAMQEVTIDYAGAGAENTTGGVRVNLVPREGGNVFSGSIFGTFATSGLQGDNLDDDLRGRGLAAANSVVKNYDINPGFGGPLKRDKLWFYFSHRLNVVENNVGGLFVNRNAGNPNALTFDPDPSKQAVAKGLWRDTQVRLTWQVTPRNKIAATIDMVHECRCPLDPSPLRAVEAAVENRNFPWHQHQFSYTAPITSSALFEAVVYYRYDEWSTNNRDGTQDPRINPILIQSTGLNYRAQEIFQDLSLYRGIFHRAAFSYVTGSHNYKIGFNNDPSWHTDGQSALNPVAYQVNRPIEQGGTATLITLRATPWSPKIHVKRSLGIYAQDRWTMDRLTLAYGVRYDHFKGEYPEQRFGPTVLTPDRNLTLPAADGPSWHDLSPKSALTYDVFGNARTAAKLTLNRYVGAAGTGGIAGLMNPFNQLINTTTRAWGDANRDFIPNCDLVNPAANGECGAMSNSNFGKTVPGVKVDPELASGFGVREFNWEFSTGVQHELVSGFSVEASYFRRWYGNFFLTDNLNVAASDYDRFSVTAPLDPRLPGGGGYQVSGLYDLNPAKFGQPANSVVTLARNYGKQTDHWNGVDVIFNGRLRNGLRFQGGTSTGRTTTDNCDVRERVPEVSPLNPYCQTNTGFRTEVKGFATYTVPRIDVLLSATFQSSVGPLLAANQVVPTAAVQPSLGRDLSGRTANVTVNLLAPGTQYGERLNQLDLRFGKVVRLGRTRTVFNVDLFNATNSNAVLTENPNFAVWRRPTSILMARFLKFGLQFDF